MRDGGKTYVTVAPGGAEVLKKAVAPAVLERGVRKPSVAARVRELSAAGRTNAEVWDVVRAEFGMPDSKRWHVAWYVADARRRAARARA